MSSVLITSATSSSGIALCRALAPRAQVLATGCRSETSMAPLFAGSGVRYLQADLSRSRELRWLLFGPALDARVDAVVHALSPGVQARRCRPADALRELMHLCERHPTIRQFIHLGSGEVYRARADDPALIDEEHPLESAGGAAPWLRDLIEVDQMACVHMGASPLRVAVLRCAETYAPGEGELQRWLSVAPCLRPLGFDPMVNLLSLEDLASAVSLALAARPVGVFNVPGADTMPLSELAGRAGRTCLPIPGVLVPLFYRLRALAPGPAFDYATNEARFHYGGVLCGEAAFSAFRYRPCAPIRWPVEPGLLPAAAPPERRAAAPRATIAAGLTTPVSLDARRAPPRPTPRAAAGPGPTRDRISHPRRQPPA